MKIFTWCFVLAALLPVTGCLSESEQRKQQSLQEINNNLGGIESQLAGIRSISSNLEQINASEKNTAQILSSIEQAIRPTNKIDSDALRDLNLPANATREQTEEYIQMIISVSKHQNSYSEYDPQVRMLTKVGHGNLELLLLRQHNFYVGAAVRKLVTAEDKDLVLKYLGKDYLYSPATLKVVTDMGWAKDAKTKLLFPLKVGYDNIPIELIAAIASMQDPETYPLLLEYFSCAQPDEAMTVYPVLKKLPGIKIDDTIKAIWEDVINDPESDLTEKTVAAYFAAEYGTVMALEYLIITLASPEIDMPDTMRAKLQTAVWQLTGQEKNPEEMLKWFFANSESLSFDKSASKFIVSVKEKSVKPEEVKPAVKN
jgi:hypothetical protein